MIDRGAQIRSLCARRGPDLPMCGLACRAGGPGIAVVARRWGGGSWVCGEVEAGAEGEVLDHAGDRDLSGRRFVHRAGHDLRGRAGNAPGGELESSSACTVSRSSMGLLLCSTARSASSWTLVDPDSRLRWQVVPAPADAVVFQGAAHPVVGHGTVQKADAAAATLSGWSLPV